MNIIYLSSFFIAAFILLLLKKDLKKFKITLYDEINCKIWIKIYIIITIGIIHLLWLFSSLFLNYNDSSLIYAFPPILLLPYMIYVIIDSKKDMESYETIVSKKINKYLNYLMMMYFVYIIILIIIPYDIKYDSIIFIKKNIKKILNLLR
jgi:hypothetical protein